MVEQKANKQKNHPAVLYLVSLQPPLAWRSLPSLQNRHLAHYQKQIYGILNKYCVL